MPLAGHCSHGPEHVSPVTCRAQSRGVVLSVPTNTCRRTPKRQFLCIVQSTTAQTEAGPCVVGPHWCAAPLIGACTGLNSTLSSALKLGILAFTGERLVLHDLFQTIHAVGGPQPQLQPRAPSLPKSCNTLLPRGMVWHRVFETWKELDWFLNGFLLGCLWRCSGDEQYGTAF